MALTYSFYANSEIQNFELEKSMSQSKHVATAVMRLDDYRSDMINREYGFRPQSGILFRLDKFAEDDFAFLEMLRISLLLIESGIGMALLLFDGEIAVFLKTRDRLILNSSRNFWDDPIRVGQIRMPFESKHLPNLV